MGRFVCVIAIAAAAVALSAQTNDGATALLQSHQMDLAGDGNCYAKLRRSHRRGSAEPRT
jgi:hypothetical protein